MSEYRQYPNPEPHGRHAQARATQHQQEPSHQSAAHQPQTARRQPVAKQPQQGAHRQPAARQPQQGAHYQPGAQQPQAVRRQPGAQQHQQGAYRPVAQAGAYRPVPMAHATTGGGSGRPPAGYSKPTKKGGPWRIVFWIALVVLVVSLAALGVIGFSYWQGQQSYNEVAQDGFTPPSDIEGVALADLTVDWDALKAINPDTVGWIYVPGTNINYPIVHTTNNDTYLTHDFKGSEGWIATFGAIFLAAENAGDFSDANNIVYGHHLNDGSMFAGIADLEKPDEFNGHRTVYLLTPQGNYQLTTFSLVHCGADDPLAQMTFSNEDERVAYVQDKADRSVVDVADLPAATDMTQTFAFATCDNLPTDGRWVLFAYVADTTVGASATGSESSAAADAQDGLVDPDGIAAVDTAAKEVVS